MAENILGNLCYKLCFPFDWKPKSAKLSLVNRDDSIHVEITSTCQEVLENL